MSGGGGSTGVYYANQDKLFGTQADIAQNMYNEYAARAPGYLDNTQSMVNEAMSGALANRMRGQAGADASFALGQGLQAASRSAARYGAEYNPNRMAQTNADTALQGAAMKTGALNQASQWAEDQKWNRNAGAYGQIAGMGSGAMEGMGSAARGYGQMAADMGANDRANAQGYGAAGAMVGRAMFAADGGVVRDPRDGAAKMAAGGLAPVNWRSQPTMGGPRKSGGGAGQFLAGMAPTVLNYGLKQTGLGKQITGGIKDAISGVKNSVASVAGAPAETAAAATDALAATDVAGLSETVSGAEAATGAAATTAAEVAALEAASLAAAEAGLGAFGGAAAGAEAGAAAGPWGAVIGAGIGALSSLFADGGPVERKDMTKGGRVSGPGTETSDDIPAWLSNNEYVLNAEAVKEIGAQELAKGKGKGTSGGGIRGHKADEVARAVGVQKLNEVNARGLKKRGAKQAERGLPVGRDGAVKLSGGGNLGIALGSGVNTLMRLDEADIRKNADKRAAESHGIQMEEGKIKLAEAKAMRDGLASLGAGLEKISKGDMTPFLSGLDEYNANAGIWNNGKKMQVSPDGKQLQHIGPDGRVLETTDFTPQKAAELFTLAHDYKMATTSPKLYADMRDKMERAKEKAADRAHNMERENIRDKRFRDLKIMDIEARKEEQRNSPAWGQVALSREEKTEARKEKAAKAKAAFELYKERNPKATAAELAAAERGILSAVPKASSRSYDLKEISNFFATQTTDEFGKPTFVRDKEREDRFFAHLAAENITDPDSGMLSFLAKERKEAEAKAAAEAGKFVKINGKNVAKADIVATAKKHNITEDEVIKRYGAKK